MLIANKIDTKGFPKDACFEVSAAGAAIAVINDTKSNFELNGRSFSITRSGVLAPEY